MPHILVLDRNVSGEASISGFLVKDAPQRLVDADPGTRATLREVSVRLLPQLPSETLVGVPSEATAVAESRALALFDELIAEPTQADNMLIGPPMYTFSISTGLRAGFDHMLRPRLNFVYSEAGVQGLAAGKTMFVVDSRGVVYTEGPTPLTDFQDPCLAVLLGLIGLTGITFTRAERIDYGPEAREGAIAGAKSRTAAAVVLPITAAARPTRTHRPSMEDSP